MTDNARPTAQLRDDLDTHDWSLDPEPSLLIVDAGRSYPTRCARCSRRRHGPYAEHGNYHYFIYDQVPGGVATEWIPPCETAPEGHGGITETVVICLKCQHLLVDDACPYGHASAHFTITHLRKS